MSSADEAVSVGDSSACASSGTAGTSSASFERNDAGSRLDMACHDDDDDDDDMGEEDSSSCVSGSASSVNDLTECRTPPLPPRIPKTIISFKVPSKIPAKSTDECTRQYIIDSTKKKKKKHFKGLSYSFLKKKKKKSSKRVVPVEDRQSTPEQNNGDQAVKVATRPAKTLKSPVKQDWTCVTDSRSNDSGSNECRVVLGKARKSVPYVVLKKSFIPAASEPSVERLPPVGQVVSDDVSSAKSLCSSGAESRLPATDRHCTCQQCRTPLALSINDTAGEAVFCQAVDSLDSRIIGCCNTVHRRRLLRPGVRVPYQLLCSLHRRRMRRHHCCPICGVFCTQGVFVRCAAESGVVHLFHKQCAGWRGGGAAAACCHCGHTHALAPVRLTIRTDRTLTFFQQQRLATVSHRTARMSASGLAVGDSVLLVSSDSVSVTLADGSVHTATVPPLQPHDPHLLATLAQLSNSETTAGNKPVGSNKEQLRWLATGDVARVVAMLTAGWRPQHKYAEHSGPRHRLEQPTALHVAALHDRASLLHVLITCGGDVEARDAALDTPLMVAARGDAAAAARRLLAAGASLKARGADGMTALHIAAQTGSLAVCHCLLSGTAATSDGQCINSQDDGGWTPMVWASEHGHTAVVRYLLRSGADPRICDEEQNTALHWAAYAGSSELVELFVAAGRCGVDEANVYGDTALHVAARRGHHQCVAVLLCAGARQFVRNCDGMLAVECAAAVSVNSEQQSGHEKCRQAIELSMQLSRLGGGGDKTDGAREERVLSNDISGGRERVAVQAVNGRDDTPLPTDYTYMMANCESVRLNIDRAITSLHACSCVDNCVAGESACVCARMSAGCWYTADGRLSERFNYAEPPMLFECSSACRCHQLTCNNRAVQHGITARLQLYRTSDRGWGVRAAQRITRGTFVCEYIGELLTDCAADQRDDDSYLFDLDNRDGGDTFCIDARRYGNVARFINHRCQPNLVPVKVFVDHHDLRVPRIALFACRDVQVDEELGFDYGDKFWMVKYKKFTCCCKSDQCRYSSLTIHDTIAKQQRKMAAGGGGGGDVTVNETTTTT